MRDLTAGSGSSVAVTSCQVCGHTPLEPSLFLGYLPPVNRMPAVGAQPCEQSSYPAQLLLCPHCQLVQLGLIVDPQILFPADYPYTSGTTRILHDNFADMAAEARALLGLGEADAVIDVGSNDGTLLSKFARHGHPVFGIEPTDAGNLALAAGIPTLRAYFTKEVGERVRAERGGAALVTATNCFAHIENIHDVLAGVVAMMAEDGVFISESHYLMSLLDTLQYDTIYHEHLRYYSLTSLTVLLEMGGLEVIHARRIPTHGGSIRVYAARPGRRPVQPSVAALLAEEQARGPMSRQLAAFRTRVVESKLALLAMLRDIKAAGGRVAGISAPSRASTLATYCGLDDGILDYVCEIKGSHKIGRLLPGTLVPVIEESRLFEDQPDYALLFSWHIADDLMPKLRAKGFAGRFIIPLPAPHIVG